MCLGKSVTQWMNASALSLACLRASPLYTCVRRHGKELDAAGLIYRLDKQEEFTTWTLLLWCAATFEHPAHKRECQPGSARSWPSVFSIAKCSLQISS